MGGQLCAVDNVRKPRQRAPLRSGQKYSYNKCSTSEAILTGQDSKPKQQFSLRLAANRFEARIAASVSNSQGVGQPWQER